MVCHIQPLEVANTRASLPYAAIESSEVSTGSTAISESPEYEIDPTRAGLIGQVPKYSWVNKPLGDWDTLLQQQFNIYTSQQAWNAMTPTWLHQAGLEVWDTLLTRIDSRFGPSFNHCTNIHESGERYVYDECYFTAAKFGKFLKLNQGSPFLANNHRVAINMAKLGEEELQKEFPMAANANGHQLVTLWEKVIVTSFSTHTATSVQLFDSPTLLNVEPVSEALCLENQLPLIAIRILAASIWRLYSEPKRHAEIMLFFKHAVKQIATISGSQAIKMVVDYIHQLAFMIITLATLRKDEPIVSEVLRILEVSVDTGSKVGEPLITREAYWTTLQYRNMQTASRNLDAVWPPTARGNTILTRPWNTIPLYTQVFQLTDEGELIQSVPSAGIQTPGLLDKPELKNSITGRKVEDYRFAEEIQKRAVRIKHYHSKKAKRQGADPVITKMHPESEKYTVKENIKWVGRGLRILFDHSY
ncbi:hypothetical protein H4R33_003767 [Dimargaris cristalligena]|nr:hypothetical protein H4R33_003767 [Dimargaris cristalligena]